MAIRALRAWPVPMPAHRAYVVDELERLHQTDYDYTPLGAWFAEHPDECGVIIIEWDVAVDPDEAANFERMAAVAPERPLATGHRLHHVEPYGSVWAHRVISGEGERWAMYGEPLVDYIAFGMVYLPRTPVLEFLQAESPARGAPLATPGGYEDGRFTDQTFSMWYRHRYSRGGPFRVEWRVRPVHLHGRER